MARSLTEVERVNSYSLKDVMKDTATLTIRTRVPSKKQKGTPRPDRSSAASF